MVAGLLLGLLLVVWVGGSPFVTRKIETLLRESLAKRQLEMTWQGGAWDPFRGMHLKNVKLVSTADGAKKPVAELDNLKVSFSLWQFISGGQDRVVYCGTDDANIVLTDPQGSVALEDATLRVEVRPRQDIRVTRAHVKKAGATADATGEILLSPVPAAEDGPFTLNLGALRATIASLDFKDGTGPFKVKGKFHVDLSGDESTWNVTADATGTKVDYRGILLDKAEGTMDLKSSGGSVIKTISWSPYGEVRGEITRENWHGGTPLFFAGTAKDLQGRESGFKGVYQEKTFTLERLAGSADLLEMSKAAPGIVKIPRDKVKFTAFEHVDIRNLRWRQEGGPRLSVESVAVKGGTVAVDFGGEDVALRNLSVAAASNDGKAWQIREAKAGIFSGTLTASGDYADGKLRDARVSAEGLRMAELKLPGGDDSGKERPGILAFNWRGTLDFDGKAMDGGGSMRMDKAPVVQVPLLDQVYDLFTVLVPGIDRSKEGSFEADFQGDGDLVRVNRFEARGGSLTVSATGTVNLEKKRVDGKARGKLNGLPGLVTSPLSRLLEMEVAGPFDDIRVKPLGGTKLVSNAASGTVGVAVDTIEEGAKITGTVIKEGIKLPFRLLGGKKDGEKREKSGSPQD